jgi:UDP-N-acetylmuramyl tripeptide synthase
MTTSVRFYIAVIAGKISYHLARMTGSGGAALPGLIATKLDPYILTRLGEQCQDGIILVCGTNGKTTTSRFLEGILKTQYPHLMQNRSGANLIRGHVSAFLQNASWFGKISSGLAILEVDEAILPEILKQLQPKMIVLGNLFRDQLDRYGEVNSIAKKWTQALHNLAPKNCQLIVNGDDPNLAFLAKNISQPVKYYGLDDQGLVKKSPTSTIDAVLAPTDNQPLEYSGYFLSHLGIYHDKNNTFKRPTPDFSGQHILLQAENSTFELVYESDHFQIQVPIPGLYNVYNALAAASSALLLGCKPKEVINGLQTSKGVFGRFEKVSLPSSELTLCLIKNPVGATEVIHTIKTQEKSFNLILAANDNFADGLDVSWYWDTDFEKIVPSLKQLTCTGNRALDMALRLKYAGFEDQIVVSQSIKSVFRELLEQNKNEIPTYVLATYTASLEIQKFLAHKNLKKAYWLE